MSTHPYLLTNAAAQAGDRFSALSALFDSVTFGHFGAVGLDEGWRCWEVGAGGSWVPARLASVVGPRGHVLATDIDTAWLEEEQLAGVEIRTHDVATDDPPPGGFDLVHARLVLVHVPRRAEALRRMAAALRPGGWLVIEDFDTAMLVAACPDAVTAAAERANKIRQGFMTLLASRGVDLEYGRQLPRLLRAVGLEDVRADAYFPVSHPAARLLEQANTAQVASGLISAGLATTAEIEDHLSALVAGEIDIATPPLVAAWGRKG